MEEIWQPIEGYSLYEVSNLGRVRSKHHGIWSFIRPGTCYGRSGKKYAIINITQNKVKKSLLLHRVVGKAFIPNPENKPTVDHINRNRLDNRVENLRWATRKEQQANRDLTPGATGQSYIFKNSHGTYTVHIREFVNTTTPCFAEAIQIRDTYLQIKKNLYTL